MSAAAPGTIGGNGVPIVGWDKDGFPICAEKEFTESVIVPAQPGWSAIIHPGCKGCGGDEWWSSKTIVIAWRVSTHRFPSDSACWGMGVSTTPITATDAADAEPDGAAIVLPDGTVEDFLHGRFDSREEWEEAARKWWEKNNQPKNADGE